jgi:hypothetical protein
LFCLLSGPTYTKLTGFENVRCTVYLARLNTV